MNFCITHSIIYTISTNANYIKYINDLSLITYIIILGLSILVNLLMYHKLDSDQQHFVFYFECLLTTLFWIPSVTSAYNQSFQILPF
jgi:hypothetical protein